MVSIILIRAVIGAISTSRDVALDSIFNIGAIYSVAVFKLRLKTSSSLRLSLLSLLSNTLPGPSASDVTTLRRYTNLLLLLCCLLVYIVCFPTPFFFNFPYSPPPLLDLLRIDPFRFQAGCSKMRLNLALAFCSCCCTFLVIGERVLLLC